MPEECALHMLRFVKQTVRDQQRCPNCDGRADDKVRGRRRPTHPPHPPAPARSADLRAGSLRVCLGPRAGDGRAIPPEPS